MPDTEVPGIQTVHGRVDFIQLEGVMQVELDWVAGRSSDGAAKRAQVLLHRMVEAGNPYLVTDLARTECFAG